MKNNYLYLFLLLLLSNFCLGQDCTAEKEVSDPTICIGGNASITLFASESGVSYQLRETITNTDIGTAQIGDGNNLVFIVSPTTTTTYYILASYSPTSCSTVLTDQSIVTVNPLPNIILSSANATQTRCQNVAITNITYTVTDAADASVSGLPTGVTGNFLGGVFTISGTPTVSGIFNFTVTTSGGCAPAATAIGTITVNPIPNVVATNPTQIRCSGVAMATMVLSGTTPGSTFNWSRDNTADVTGIANSGSGNISGTLVNTTNSPVIVTFTIIPTANGCDGNPIYTTVEVKPTPGASATNPSQTICSGASIATIALSGNVAGTTFNWTRNNFTGVSGIPLSGSGDITGSLINTNTTARTITFTITPTANGCNGPAITASVVINPIPVITAAVPNQIKCSGVALGTFSISSTVLGTTYEWTRDNIVDVTGIGSSGTGVIAGTLTNNTLIPQTVNFTVTPTANNCQGAPITVSVLVNPTPNVVATPTSQTVCSGAAITDIILSGNVAGTTYTWTRTETIDLIGIPASGSGDINGTLTNVTNTAQTAVFTIRPNANSCNGSTITVSVTVNPMPTVSASNTNQTICSATAISPILVAQNVTGTTFNWTRDNTTNVTGTANNGSLTSGQSISGTLTNQTAINQTVTFTIIPTANGCAGTPVTATIIVEPRSLGGVLILTASPASPLNNSLTVCHNSGTGTLYLSGQRGNVVRWESSTDSGVTWIPITVSTTAYNYPNVTVSTLYRAVVKYGTCPDVFSKAAIINVIPDIKPSPVTATPATICNGQSSVLTSVSGYASNGTLTTGGTFNSSNPPGWLVGACGNCLSAGSSNTDPGPWQLSATNGGIYFAGLPTTPASNGTEYTSDNKFAIASGAVTTYLSTPVFSTLGSSTASLTFADAYKLVAGASISIQISVNGGAYTTLWSDSGPSNRTPYTDLHLNGRAIDLTDYLGQTNLRIRFAFIGNVGSSWAVDNIAIPSAPENLNYSWVDITNGQVVSNEATLTVTPSVTTTYQVVSNLNGCVSTLYTEVTVTVIDRPTAIISQNQYICYNTPATLTVHFTGSGPYRFTLKALNTATNGVTNTVYNNITPNASGNYTFNTGNLTATMVYTITALNDTKCTSISDDIDDSTVTVTVLNGTQGLWTGLISTDWFDCRNWAGGLPSATIDAVIPTGAVRMPVIDPLSPFAAAYSYIASARDVIINTSASITMNANSNLQVKKDWKNRGSFSPGTGTVTFNGAIANQVQLINSTIKLNEGFYNLTLNCTNGAKGINLADAFELTVANNLVLTSGDLRLTGEAQLVQNGTTANPAGGTGVLLRDQQGTKSSYHYNYWSSPVSADNVNYTIGGVLKDGTNAVANPFTQAPITFGSGYFFADGALTNPIKISNEWLYKYTQISTSYWSWQLVGSTGNIKVGEGYTMKGVTGSEPVTNYQNYVFAGKPNNGNISLTIAANQLYLIGNPYPSALNADEFIKDNIRDNGRAATNVFNGALYFWDHFGATTHILGQYVGGYATYSLIGGVVAVSSDPMINNNMTSSTKIPKRYIPVAQGFFVRTDLGGVGGVTSAIPGGTISFKNSQRAFKVESTANSLFIRDENGTVDSDIDNRQRIRLSFEAPTGLRRQLLVGADPQASNLFDLGYDAPMIDVNPDDMFWNFSDGKFVIQAVNDFDVDQVIPLGIKVSTAGATTIKIDELENIPASTEIYLFDSVTGLYHDIRNEDFVADFPVGEYLDRFSLRFTAETLSTDETATNNGIMVFADANQILNIKNNFMDARVETVQLYNILGQSIAKWNVTDEDQRNIKIPVEHIRSGTYIVKLRASNGLLSKKVLIR